MIDQYKRVFDSSQERKMDLGLKVGAYERYYTAAALGVSIIKIEAGSKPESF
jgi:hypothetical protein